MLEKDLDFKEQNNNIPKGLVHFVLSHSYLIYLVVIILGVILDTIFSIKIFHNQIYQYVGFFVILISTIIVYWAQKTSQITQKEKDLEGKSMNFEKGPYRYSRYPTHVGLSLIIVGFGLVLKSFFIVVSVLITLLITHIFFKKEIEKLLEKKYGQTYSDYKQKVRTWI